MTDLGLIRKNSDISQFTQQTKIFSRKKKKSKPFLAEQERLGM